MKWVLNKDEVFEYKNESDILIGAVFRGAIKKNNVLEKGCVAIIYGPYPNIWCKSNFCASAREAKKWIETNL